MKKKLLLTFLMVLFPSLVYGMIFFNDAADIPIWARENTVLLVEENIMNGYEDGSFKPNNQLNRAEALVIIFRTKGIEFKDTTGASKFSDISPNDWFTPAILEATNQGWLKGYPDGTVKPEKKVNKAEWAVMLKRAFDLEVSPETVVNYDDVKQTHWYYEPVVALMDHDLIRVRSRLYDPEGMVTRADAVWMIGEMIRQKRAALEAEKIAKESEQKVAEQKATLSEQNKKLDSSRVAIKPKNFDADEQGYQIEKEEVNFYIVPAEESLTLTPTSDWAVVGELLAENVMDNPVELSTLDFELRFTERDTGPESEFFYKIEGGGKTKEAHFGGGGDMFIGNIAKTLQPGESVNFTISIKPDSGGNFYQERGEGVLGFKSGEAIMIQYKAGRLAPTHMETGRDLARFRFLP